MTPLQAVFVRGVVALRGVRACWLRLVRGLGEGHLVDVPELPAVGERLGTEGVGGDVDDVCAGVAHEDVSGAAGCAAQEDGVFALAVRYVTDGRLG